jgi:hypothetical protein
VKKPTMWTVPGIQRMRASSRNKLRKLARKSFPAVEVSNSETDRNRDIDARPPGRSPMLSAAFDRSVGS